MLPPSLQTLLSVERWAVSPALPVPAQLVANTSCRSSGKGFYPEPVSPLLPSFPVAKPGNQTPGNATAPSCSSKVRSQGASAHLCCNRGTGSAGKRRHQILHLQPKVTMLEGRKGRGNVVHTAIQKVGFVPGSSAWQGNKVNVKTTGRHIPQ